MIAVVAWQKTTIYVKSSKCIIYVAAPMQHICMDVSLITLLFCSSVAEYHCPVWSWCMWLYLISRHTVTHFHHASLFQALCDICSFLAFQFYTILLHLSATHSCNLQVMWCSKTQHQIPNGQSTMTSSITLLHGYNPTNQYGLTWLLSMWQLSAVMPGSRLPQLNPTI